MEGLHRTILKFRHGRPLTEFANIQPGIAYRNIGRLSDSGICLTSRAWRNLMQEGVIYRILGDDLFDKYATLDSLHAAIEASSTAVSFDGINTPMWPRLKHVGSGRYILDIELFRIRPPQG
jgi:hypothetical protein